MYRRVPQVQVVPVFPMSGDGMSLRQQAGTQGASQAATRPEGVRGMRVSLPGIRQEQVLLGWLPQEGRRQTAEAATCPPTRAKRTGGGMDSYVAGARVRGGDEWLQRWTPRPRSQVRK